MITVKQPHGGTLTHAPALTALDDAYVPMPGGPHFGASVASEIQFFKRLVKMRRMTVEEVVALCRVPRRQWNYMRRVTTRGSFDRRGVARVIVFRRRVARAFLTGDVWKYKKGRVFRAKKIA